MDILSTAAHYVQQKFSVLPVATNGSKQSVGSWKPYQTRFATEHELQQWFTSQQPCGIAIACGPISGNLSVIDFDYQAEQTYSQWFASVQQQLPDVSDQLFIVETPRPGYHVWFRTEAEPPAGQVLAWTQPQQQFDSTGQPVQDADGSPVLEPKVRIELRSTGHYVIAPGSPAATHPSGRPYRVLQGNCDTVPVLAADQTQRLLELARSYTQYQPQHVQRQPGQTYRGEPRPGDIFNQQTDLRQLLMQHGWQLHHSVEDVEHLTRPGKPIAAGTSATLGALRSDDGKPLLYVFSSAAAPFEAGSTYDAFACYALLEHRGDFSRAAATVRIRYAEQVRVAQQTWQQENAPQPAAYKPFPVELLPDVVQEYVVQHSQAIGIDAAFVAVPMLPVLAGLIGQSRRLYIKRNWTEPSILWAVTIADVSTGKTPGWQAATAPAKAIERSIYELRRQAEQQHQQAMQDWQRGDKQQPKPTKPEIHTQITLDDISMESLIEVHQHNWHGLLLTVDELAGWLRSFDQYRAGKGRDVENWLSIYNGNSCQVNRKTDGYRVYMPSTAISVCGTIQPEVAKATLFSEKFIDNGFAARILSAMPPAHVMRWTESEVPEHVDKQIHQLAQRLYALPGEDNQQRSLYLPFTADAKAAWIRYYNDAADYAKQLEPSLRFTWLKLRPVAARFALVLSVVDQLHKYPDGQATQPVDLQYIQSGIQLAMWFGKELERNYQAGIGSKQDNQETHLQWIRRTHPKGIDVRTLQQGRRSIETAEQARQILQQLLEAGHGRLDGQTFIPG
jgi:hypothetical protein